MNYFFDDLALPRLIRTQLLADAPEWKTRRAGFVSEGNPTSLHVVRSMRVALGRRIAMGGDARVELRRLEEHLKQLEELDHTPLAEIDELQGGDRGAAPAPQACALPRSRSTCATATACASRCPPARPRCSA